MPSSIEEEVISVTLQDVTISTLIDLESFNVLISEEALNFLDVEDDFSVEIIDAEVFKETFTESERIIISNDFRIEVLNKAERKDIVQNSPNPGDITIYYGLAAPQSLDSNPVWLITRQIYLDPDFDSGKKFASPLYDQVWDDYLGLTYS